MIRHISICNYALIERTEIGLERGFSVITGETGAGKSILLGAIGLTLGQRADSSAIMDKGRKCVVEIVYGVEGYGLEGWFEENGLDYAEEVIVRREVTAEGKSRGFINDTPVGNRVLKEFGEFMVDVHSQHQSLLLGRPEYQTEVLDAFCGNGGLLEEYAGVYGEYRRKRGELEEARRRVAEAEREGDYLRFRYGELEGAQLKEGEKEELEGELGVLANAEGIKSALGGMAWRIREEEGSVVGVLKQVRGALAGVEGAFPEAAEYGRRLDSVIIELNDLADEGARKAEGVEFNGGRVEAVHARLNVIYDLLYKYKVETVGELVGLRERMGEDLRRIEGGGEEIGGLERELEGLEGRMRELCGRLRRRREEERERLCGELKRLLVGLGIRHAEFVVELSPTGDFTPRGCDEVRFLFSANMNQEPGEISRVASGGEISRVMLALKYVLSGAKQLPVIVFDEIDTGLSGEVAHRMAQMMKEMSGRMQVVSISHLPQIAAAGDCHFKVYKEDGETGTVSRIRRLSAEERVREIAGMMSGEGISRAALDAAGNLLKQNQGLNL